MRSCILNKILGRIKTIILFYNIVNLHFHRDYYLINLNFQYKFYNFIMVIAL